MKPKNPKHPPATPSHLEIQQDTGQEMQQVMSFETVDEMLSFDRSETALPDGVVRKLTDSLPDQKIKPLPEPESKTWKPRKD
jgi:hypothetical protein